MPLPFPWRRRETGSVLSLSWKEALVQDGRHHTSYSLETKLSALQDHLTNGLTEVEVMRKYGIHRVSFFLTWCRLYRAGSPGALKPRKRG